MTRKDYIVIASAMRYGRTAIAHQNGQEVWNAIYNELVRQLHADNSRFDSARFLIAARGPEEPGLDARRG